MKSIRYKYALVSVFFLLIVVSIFYSINYVQNEGFNPTDEGVVLAQSWRIINGEIPHKDFISIRPAGSGYLHSLIFAIPGSLVVNARWFVLFQFFVIAAVISTLFFRIQTEYREKEKSIVYFISLLIAGFTLSVFNYNLYSWTTIDAVFWTVLALPLLYSKNKWKNSLALLFVSIAALSRQTFGIVVLLSFLYVFYVNRRSFVKYIPVFLIGALPFICYSFMLFWTGSFNDFISQMTGRTEFFQTAITQFVIKFVVSYTTPLNLITFIVVCMLYIRRKSGIIQKFTDKSFHIVFAVIYFFVSFGLIIQHFLKPEMDIYSLPFSLFYMSFFFGILHFVLLPRHLNTRKLVFYVLVISWVSAISLGDNSPVFSTGILLISLMIMCIDIVISIESKSSGCLLNKYALLILAVIVFGFGIYGQSKVNYRDLSKEHLITGLNKCSGEFGQIKANKFVVDYYNELSRVYKTLECAENNTVVFPHNAMFYPVMKTRNPAPLDWITANEYIGQEDRVVEDFSKILNQDGIYFIVDKFDVRSIRDGLTPREFENDLIYDLIIENCSLMDVESEYFTIYKTQDS